MSIEIIWLLSSIFISHVNRIRAQKTKENVHDLSTNKAFKRFKLKTKQWLSIALHQSLSYRSSVEDRA
jgi:hypothetical protein